MVTFHDANIVIVFCKRGTDGKISSEEKRYRDMTKEELVSQGEMEKSSEEIRSAVRLIKSAILQSQARAIQMVNQEQLSLYYGIGRYVSEH